MLKIDVAPYFHRIKPENALHPKDRMNNPGISIEVSTRSTYHDYYLTFKEIGWAIATGGILGVAIPIARGLLGIK